MQLSPAEWLLNYFGIQSLADFGGRFANPVADVAAVHHGKQSPAELAGCEAYFHLITPEYGPSTTVLIKDNLAVIPDSWESGGVKAPFYDAAVDNSPFSECLNHIKAADFIAFDSEFLGVIGPDAKLETIHTFTDNEAEHVHEAPIWLPDTNELLFSDTTAIGWLYAINIDTHSLRKITTTPPLPNINGGTRHHTTLYLTTNGSPTRAIHACTFSTPSHSHLSCKPLINNYRLSHLNSPNDLIFTSTGNIIFTDPPYGWLQDWPGVGAPELPPTIYHFDMKTKALLPLSNNVVAMPNGLALSPDEMTLYVADSNSTSGKPLASYGASVRNVYAFDFDVGAPSLRNQRLLHVCEVGWPDGLRVTESGLVMVAGMGGVDVVDPGRGGLLVGKINVHNDVVFNLEPVGGGSGVWLLTGKKAVYKVTIKEKGLDRAGF